MHTEIWKPVVGYEGSYEVSNLGRVRSLDRTITQASKSGSLYSKKLKGRILRPGSYDGEHVSVSLGRDNSKPVHKLVLEAFVSPRPAGMEALHGDGKGRNNKLTNLRWGTRSQNNIDASQHDKRKLKVKQVIYIYSKRTGRHCDAVALAGKFDCCVNSIYAVWKGKNWSHVTRP